MKTAHGTEDLQTLRLSSIVRSDALMAREGLDADIVAAYGHACATGEALPPVDVFRDAEGALWLADGWHRCAALEALGRPTVEAIVHEGEVADAMLFAAGANTRHGLPRKPGDAVLAAIL